MGGGSCQNDICWFQFITAPQNIGLRYFLDIKFAPNGASTILASRAVLQAKGLINWNDDATLMSEVRAVCKRSKLKSVAFMEFFIFFDQV